MASLTCHTCGFVLDPVWPYCARCYAARALGWPEIYARLSVDRVDPLALLALESYVATWLRFELRDFDPAQHEDAVGEVREWTLEHFEQAHGAATFGGFVYGHYRNVKRALLEAKRRGCRDDVELPTDGPDNRYPDESDLLVACLERLRQENPRQWRAVLLRYEAEASARHIAAALGVTEANARKLVSLGLQRLTAYAQAAWPAGRG